MVLDVLISGGVDGENRNSGGCRLVLAEDADITALVIQLIFEHLCLSSLVSLRRVEEVCDRVALTYVL